MFVYAALGDSITAGEGASAPCKAYPQQIARLLRSADVPAASCVMARPGWTSSELLQALSLKDPQPFRRANAVSVWVGGDDLIRAGLAMLRGANRGVLEAALLRYRTDLGRIARMLRTAGSGRVIVCTQYNPFPATSFVELAVGQLNRVTAETAAATGMVLAPVHGWFQGRQRELIAGYRSGRLEDAMRGNSPLHPNDRGHAVIASGLAALLPHGK